jgi:hypothetical protein
MRALVCSLEKFQILGVNHEFVEEEKCFIASCCSVYLSAFFGRAKFNIGSHAGFGMRWPYFSLLFATDERTTDCSPFGGPDPRFGQSDWSGQEMDCADIWQYNRSLH